MEFCKDYNNRTKNIKEHVHIPTSITIYNANSYEITIKTPSTTYFLKQAAEGEPRLGLKEIYHLGVYKRCDPAMSHLGLKAICKTSIGSAKSMGYEIVAAT